MDGKIISKSVLYIGGVHVIHAALQRNAYTFMVYFVKRAARRLGVSICFRSLG